MATDQGGFADAVRRRAQEQRDAEDATRRQAEADDLSADRELEAWRLAREAIRPAVVAKMRAAAYELVVLFRAEGVAPYERLTGGPIRSASESESEERRSGWFRRRPSAPPAEVWIWPLQVQVDTRTTSVPDDTGESTADTTSHHKQGFGVAADGTLLRVRDQGVGNPRRLERPYLIGPATDEDLAPLELLDPEVGETDQGVLREWLEDLEASGAKVILGERASAVRDRRWMS